MVDWAELVRVSVPDLPNYEANPADSDQAGRNQAGVVGTRSGSQVADLIENEMAGSDLPTFPTTFECSRVEDNENSNPLAFYGPAGGGAERQPAPHKSICDPSCAYFRHPGLSDGYCGGRDDLPHAYTAGHPLSHLPPDRGATCPAWRLHPAFRVES